MRVDGIAHFQGMVGLRLCYHISVYQTHLCDNDGVNSDFEEPTCVMMMECTVRMKNPPV